jgi:hypothetical protein
LIVLDEQISDPRIIRAIKSWYPGRVIGIGDTRPSSHIHDEAIPSLLRSLKWPTFVTTNYTDFWTKVAAEPAYCVICIKLPIERALEVPSILREVLKRAEFSTRRKRRGKVISISGRSVHYYE